MSRILISAAHKSSGKTTVSIGLCAALKQRRLKVQPFKKGPDYIDPMWLSQAAGRPCHNLDFYTMQHDEIIQTFINHANDADISVIEGNKGLYDGLDLDGSNSNAALGKLLTTPVILVLDARGMTRGVAPLILGYQAFDNDIRIAGVILNQLGGQRHEQKLRSVIEHYTDVEVVGALYRNSEIEITERHLGLIPSNESGEALKKIAQLSKAVSDQVDLDKVISIASSTNPITAKTTTPVIQKQKHDNDVRIGIVRDSAFGFYYSGDLEAFELAGAELVKINTITDAQLPEVDGLFIGGGFPETHLDKLEKNKSMRMAIKDAIESGMPCYAECGGLMYLARSIVWNNKQHHMVGVIPGTINMHQRPQGRGYIRLHQTGHAPWFTNPDKNAVLSGHEFHYSSLDDLPENINYAYEVKRGTGINGKNDGIIYKNLLACYAHMRDTKQSPWVSGFVDFVRRCKMMNRKES